MNEKFLAGSIKNLSNTCYISCSLQLLLRYKPFIQKIEELHQEFPDNILIEILHSYSQHFLNENTDLNPQRLVDFLNVDPKKQEDICEFLTNFIDKIIESLPKEKQKDIREIFNSKICSTGNSGGEEKTDNVFFYTIPVIRDVSIEEDLRISLDNEKFIEAPEMFLLQIQRMIYDQSTQDILKNPDPMPIVTTLDLSNFGAPKYDLFCSIQHIGSGRGGHYRAMIQDSNGWIMASDSRVVETTEEKCLISSRSRDSPAYLLAFVSDITNVSTIRREKEFDDQNTEALYVDDDEHRTLVPFILDSSSSDQEEREVQIAIQNSLNKDNKDPNAQKEITKYNIIQCAFNPNKEAKIQETPLSSITVITQFFDHKNHSFKKPDEHHFNHKEDLMELIENFKADTTVRMVYGFLEDTFTEELPKDLFYVDTPLYIMIQYADYRPFLTNPLAYSITVEYHFMKMFSFSLIFDLRQSSSLISHYGTLYLREKADLITDFSAYVAVGSRLVYVKSNKMILDYRMNQQKQITVFMYPEDYDIPRNLTQICVHVYGKDNFTHFKEQMFLKAKINPKFSMFNKKKKLNQTHFEVWVLYSPTQGQKLTDSDLRRIYTKGVDIRYLEYKSSHNALISVFSNGEFQENFIYPVKSENFKKLSEKIAKVIKTETFIVEFIRFGKQPISDGSPKELVETNDLNKSYFRITVVQ